MTEVKTQKISAEAQTENQTLEQTIAYLAEREANLSKYSNKLRQAVIKIAEKLRDKSSININDTQAYANYWTIFGEDYNSNIEVFLRLTRHGLCRIAAVDINDETSYVQELYFDSTSRRELMLLIKSGRITTFLAYAAQKLAETEQEFKVVAEAAEKMAASLQ